MSLYDKIFDVVAQFRKLFSPGSVTNADVSGSITAEIFLIVSLVLATLLLFFPLGLLWFPYIYL